MDIINDIPLSQILLESSDILFFFDQSLSIKWANKNAENFFSTYPRFKKELEEKLHQNKPNLEHNRKIEVFFIEKKSMLVGIYKVFCHNCDGHLGMINGREIIDIDSMRLQWEIVNQKRALDHAAVVAITDPAGSIIYVNDKFVKISGYSRAELIGQNHRIINSKFHPPEFFKNLWRTISSGEVWHGELRNRNKNGTYYWVDTTIVPFKNERGEIYCYVSIRFDITDRINQLKQIEDDRIRLMHAEKMASLGELAAGIAHEIGNPLASISAWLEVLSSSIRSRKFDDLSFSSTLTTVKERVDRMSKILIGMLSYARDGSNDPITAVNLTTLVRNVLDYCSLKIRNCGINVRINSFPDYLIYYCRETEISQVIVNLILNSCDAICESEERWIEIRCLDANNFIVISVIDSGPGIPETIACQIMKPFFTTKKIGRGTGLGLSISTRIIEALGGYLKLDLGASNTKFDIYLPKRSSLRG